MKTQIFVLALVLLVISCSTDKQPSNNDWTERGLKGNVKSVTESDFKAKLMFGEIQKGNSSGKTIETFNEKGNLDTYKLLDAQDSLTAEGSYKYDDLGNLVESVHHSYNEFDNATFRFKKAHTISRQTFMYDSIGNQTEINFFNQDGSLVQKSFSLFDEKGNEITEDNYNPDGTLISKIINAYDDASNKTERNNYNPDGSLEAKAIYKYDSKGRLTERYYLNSDLDIDEKYICKYDEKGLIIEELDSLWSAEKTSYKYDKFDEKGNWLYRLKMGNEIVITERDIVYY